MVDRDEVPRLRRGIGALASVRHPWMRAIISRLLLVGFGLCLAVLALEGILRVAAGLTPARAPDRPAWLGSARRILCLGDSNTYGLYVDRSLSYPRLLQTLWNSRSGERSVEVFDMGFPVTNSSKLLKEFDRMLLAFRPDVVTVMIGANDFWTVSETAPESPHLRERVAALLWRTSRAYRLFYMLAHMLQAPRVEVTKMPDHRALVRYGAYQFDLGGKTRPTDGSDDRPRGPELARNLARLPAHVAKIGAQLVFVTYASGQGFYGAANGVMRTVAKQTGTPLIDVAAEFRALCPQRPCQYFFRDEHPTGAGYERIAQVLVERLPQVSSRPR
jgi:lysophospholipase L1-like esterase